MEQQLLEQVRGFIVTNFLFGDESRLPDDEESLLESGVLDSTGVLELVDFLETDLGVEVAETETVPDNLGSIARVAEFVTRKRASSAVA